MSKRSCNRPRLRACDISPSIVAKLPSPPERKGEPLRPWEAPSLSGQGVDPAGLRYVAVDEIVGDRVGLSISGWPGADAVGRLCFPIAEGVAEAVVSAETLCRFLEGSNLRFAPRLSGPLPRGRRELRVGTVLAARVKSSDGEEWGEPLSDWLEEPVYDITKDARYVAKLAYWGAVTGKWNKEQADAYRLTDS